MVELIMLHLLVDTFEFDEGIEIKNEANHFLNQKMEAFLSPPNKSEILFTPNDPNQIISMLVVLQLGAKHLGCVEDAAPYTQTARIGYGGRQLWAGCNVHASQEHLKFWAVGKTDFRNQFQPIPSWKHL